MSRVDKSRNNAQIAKGKIKETVGRATGNHKLKANGEMDQLKGRVKQVGERAKDAFKK